MNKSAIGYLALSLFSGFVELGAVVLVIRNGHPIYYVPLAGLAYQLGALFREPLELAPWQYLVITALSLVPALFAAEAFSLFLLAVLLLSIGIQGVRGIVSERGKVSTPIKRMSRVVGFALSGFFYVQALPIIAFLVLVLFMILRGDEKLSGRARIRKHLKPGALGWIMAIHQSHYFSYAYVIPLLFIVGHEVDARIAGLLFCIGWFSYISSRRLFGDKALVRNFAVGHILATVSLAGIFFWFEASLVASLLLWFLTGFGGGTVYCLREIRANSKTDKSDLDSWENIGHIWGVLICTAILSLFGAPKLVFAAASLIAAVTCALFLMTVRKQSTVTEVA